MTDTTTADDVLGFWFAECAPAAWFTKDDAFDRRMRERFAATHARAAAGELDGWTATRAGRLALILVLDQMSRNMFRGDAKAFAQDAQAREIARRALAEGDHVYSSPEQCLFLFLPFEHSENVADQALSVALFTGLGKADWIDYADRHKVIVDRFARFPHRNETLARVSTAEEIAFLKQPGSSF